MFDLSDWIRKLSEKNIERLYSKASLDTKLQFLVIIRLIKEIRDVSEILQKGLNKIQSQLSNLSTNTYYRKR